MQIEKLQPISYKLRKFLKYFLFIKNDDPICNKKLISYPNTNHCLGLYKNSQLSTISELNYQIKTSGEPSSYLTGIYDRPCTFQYTGKFDEVCIDFEPLGLEMFSNCKVSDLKFHNNAIEELFSKDWRTIYTSAFSSDNTTERVFNLENFFLNKLMNPNTFKFIPFNEIFVHDVNEISQYFNLSYRSIHRLYQGSLGISPKKILNIQRFRKSLEILKYNTQAQSAYQCNYSDQSHMIKSFKKYTEQSPKQYLNKVHLIGQDTWLNIE